MGSSRPGHDCGMSIRLRVCVAPDCVFRNFNVFHAFRVASPFLIALRRFVWPEDPGLCLSLIADWSCCSRRSAEFLASSARDFLSDTYKSYADFWSGGRVMSIPARKSLAWKPLVSWFLWYRILFKWPRAMDVFIRWEFNAWE